MSRSRSIRFENTRHGPFAPAPFGVLVAGVLALPACDVTRLSVPSDLSTSEAEMANQKLAQRPAVVRFGTGQSLETRAAWFEGDGKVALADAVDTTMSRSDSMPFAWGTHVPVAAVREISTVDRGNGASKGFLYGALVGFTVTLFAVVAESQSEDNGGFLQPTAAESVALGAICGLAAGLVTGMVGAAIGAAVGDGAVVTVVPHSSSSSSTPAR
jgi:hypothetical protein